MLPSLQHWVKEGCKIRLPGHGPQKGGAKQIGISWDSQWLATASEDGIQL